MPQVVVSFLAKFLKPEIFELEAGRCVMGDYAFSMYAR